MVKEIEGEPECPHCNRSLPGWKGPGDADGCLAVVFAAAMLVALIQVFAVFIGTMESYGESL